MKRKTIIAVSLGILAAAIACLIAGLIVYFTANQNFIALIVGVFMICVGVIMAVVPTVLLIVVSIAYLATKKKNQ